MIIVGAGMSGLLAANMLQRRRPRVVEVQPQLPHNHSAVLRFRTSAVGDTLGINFRKVRMLKATEVWRNPVADALAYSYKNTGRYVSDRSIRHEAMMEARYIAPPDLVTRMAEGVDISYGTNCNFAKPGPFISTIPMPALMMALDYPHGPVFHSRSGINIKATVHNCDAYVSLLVPNPDLPFSRVSLTGDELIIECPEGAGIQRYTENEIAARAANLIGIDQGQLSKAEVYSSRYAKILPIDDDVRKSFIHWATVNFNVFSLGRYSVWRPGLLIDDLLADVKKIEQWLGDANRYNLAKSS